MANHGPAYGLSREIQLKNQSRFVMIEAQETLKWIQQCTGTSFERDPHRMSTESEIADSLSDGVQLCRLANRIIGKTAVKFTERPKMPFHMMENISQFLVAIKRYGVPEHACFQTVDLYENKQLYKVFECLRVLASLAEQKLARVPIPNWTVKLSSHNPRHFSGEVLKKSEEIIPLQYGTNKGASQKGMTPYGLPRQILPLSPDDLTIKV